MKKILIYQNINSLRPVGGPAGYLYNLKKSLDKMNYKIDFLPAVCSKKANLKKFLPKRIVDFLRAYKYTKIIKKNVDLPDEYFNYDVIHFHQTTDMYNCRAFLEKYTGKVVLTSHSPCAYHKELISKLNKRDVSFFHKKLKKLELIDIYAFNRADYIIFPCREAEEPYYNSWNKYSEVRNGAKIKYLYTGIAECLPKLSFNDARKKYNYSEKDFIISYVGRHNEIKGYDNLIKLGLSAIEKENVKLLVAGTNAPIKGPNNKNWCEIGWTDDPYSIINCSNVFVLPNKETYFDLIMLEVLSLGKIVLTTYTGGNKIFKRFKNIGVFYYKNEEEFLKRIKYIKSLSKREIKNYENMNKKIFHDNFTNDIFAENYIKIIEGMK